MGVMMLRLHQPSGLHRRHRYYFSNAMTSHTAWTQDVPCGQVVGAPQDGPITGEQDQLVQGDAPEEIEARYSAVPTSPR